MERPLKIKSITRLKYRDRNYNNKLKDFSIKIEFLSNFLPEFISFWSVRSKVRSFINRVRKCYNCLKWGHSFAFCRSSPVCTGCGRAHISDSCADSAFMCPDCNQIHLFFVGCSIFQKYKIINYIMAYCNINQYIAKKLVKIRNITSYNQVEKNFKSSAYLAWDNVDFSQEESKPVGRVTPSTFRSIGGKDKSKRKPLRKKYKSTSHSGQLLSENDLDVTLILNIVCNNPKESSVNLNDVAINKNTVDNLGAPSDLI